LTPAYFQLGECTLPTRKESEICPAAVNVDPGLSIKIGSVLIRNSDRLLGGLIKLTTLTKCCCILNTTEKVPQKVQHAIVAGAAKIMPRL
jgi:hypothetical protein